MPETAAASFYGAGNGGGKSAATTAAAIDGASGVGDDGDKAAEKVLAVVCCGNEAAFHLSRYTGGGHSKCVHYGRQWISPVEFEEQSGRGASHNWKRTLKHNGKSVGIVLAALRPKLSSPPPPASTKKRPLSPPTPTTASLPDGEEGERLYEALKRACIKPRQNKTVVTAAAASEMAKPSSSSQHASLSSSARARVSSGPHADNDSDSGISVDSYTKALKIDVGGGAQTATSLPPPPPPPQAASAAAPSSTAATSKPSPPVPASVAAPDYATMIQEALCSLSDSTSDAGGCSQLNVLLYILNKYDGVDEGNILVIHSKVKSGLQFLRRMGIIEKCGANGESGGADASSDEEVGFSRGSSASAGDADDVKAKKKASKKVKVVLKKVKIPNGSKKIKVVPKTSKKPEDGGGGVVKREMKSRPKRLSKELAVICGKRTLSRHEVVRNFWVYVKKHGLQDPVQKTVIVCDENLRAVTKRKRIPSTEIFACLKDHLADV